MNKDNVITPLSLNEIFKTPPMYHNVAADIAEHATSLLLGQGYSVDILRNDEPDEELYKTWEKIERFNKFPQLLERNEYDLSYWGFKILTVDRTETGQVLIMENDPTYFSKVATLQQISEIEAVVYKRVYIDQSQWAVKELWTTEKVVRTWYLDNKEVHIEELESEIPAELKLPQEEYHNLGILPVKLFLNKNRNIRNLREYYELADTFTVREQIRALNLYANQQVKEALLNITKVFGNFDAATLKKIQKKIAGNNAMEGMELNLLLSELFIDVKQQGDTGTSSKMVEILQANPAFEKYILAKEDALRNIWRGAGYTYNVSGEQTNSNAETLYANAFDIRTTKKKKTTRQYDYADLIAKCLVASGKLEWEDYINGTIQIIFNIKENAVQTPNQIIDAEAKLIELGLKSKARALMKIEQLPNLKQAEEWVEEATEEQQAEAEANYEMMAKVGASGDKNNTTNQAMTNSIEPKGDAA